MISTTSQDAAADDPREPIHIPAGAGRRYDLPSGPQVALLGVKETGGAYEIIEITAAPARGPPLHVHRHFEETFYVLDGTLTLRVGPELVHVAKGGAFAIPAGVVHTWTNQTQSPIRFLQFTMPGEMEEFTAAYSRVWRTATADQTAALADRYGTTIVGPPL